MKAELLDLLNQAPPAKELRSRQADDGTTLTYVEGRYIAQKLNEIFGPDGWSREFAGDGVRIVDRDVTVDGLHLVTAACEYRLAVRNLEGGCIYSEDIGIGRSDPCVRIGDAIESACKEAVTDALKRCARTIGNALGSCLYDKAWLAGNRPAGATVTGQTAKGRWQELEARLDGSTGSPHDDANQDAPSEADFPQEAPRSCEQVNRKADKRKGKSVMCPSRRSQLIQTPAK